MQFIYDGEFYKAIKITGPSHNILGLAITDENILIKDIKSSVLEQDIGEPINVHVNDVEKQVREGLIDINNELNSAYKIRKFQFLPSDTNSGSIYKELTMEIIRHLYKGGIFLRVNH